MHRGPQIVDKFLVIFLYIIIFLKVPVTSSLNFTEKQLGSFCTRKTYTVCLQSSSSRYALSASLHWKIVMMWSNA